MIIPFRSLTFVDSRAVHKPTACFLPIFFVEFSLQVDLSEHVSNRGGGGETGAIIAWVVCGIGAIILVPVSPTVNRNKLLW